MIFFMLHASFISSVSGLTHRYLVKSTSDRTIRFFEIIWLFCILQAVRLSRHNGWSHTRAGASKQTQ